MTSRPGNPAHFSKKLSKKTYLYFHRSIQIAENSVKISLFWPTFWKSGQKNTGFSWFSGNPADGFFLKSKTTLSQIWWWSDTSFESYRVYGQHFPPQKKKNKKVHISSIFHDSSRTKVRFDLARLDFFTILILSFLCYMSFRSFWCIGK